MMIKKIYFIFVIFFFAICLINSSEEEAKKSLQESLLKLKAVNNKLNISDDLMNTYKLMENKSIKLKITLFLKGIYGILVTGDQNTLEIKVEIIDLQNNIIKSEIITKNSNNFISVNADYTGEYLFKLTPIKVSGNDKDIKIAWISWAILYED